MSRTVRCARTWRTRRLFCALTVICAYPLTIVMAGAVVVFGAAVDVVLWLSPGGMLWAVIGLAAGALLSALTIIGIADIDLTVEVDNTK